MKAAIGLGNPGARYAETRHNAGFWVIDRLAGRLEARVNQAQDEALVGRGRYGGEELLLAKPQTFMNESGRAIAALARRYGLVPDEILVIYDDLALDTGVLRMRAKGSAGGHNGVKSVIHYLGTESFPRLRIGIGAVPAGMQGVEYVLGVPGKEERTRLEAAVDAAVQAVLAWVGEGIERAMSRVNAARGASHVP